MSRFAPFGLALALVLLLFGVAVIYWPAAVIVAALALGAVCLLADDGITRGGSDE